jgi:hypothetical protein
VVPPYDPRSVEGHSTAVSASAPRRGADCEIRAADLGRIKAGWLSSWNHSIEVHCGFQQGINCPPGALHWI